MGGRHAEPAARTAAHAPARDRPAGEPEPEPGSAPAPVPAVADLGPGSRIEHEDGRVWRIVGGSARAVRVAMPDGRTPWIDRASLRRQLAGEPVTIDP